MIQFIFSLFVTLFASTVFAIEIDTYEFLMPNVYPHRNELYLCSPIRISPDVNYYIVGFQPNASMNTAHHMLLYGCATPGTDDPVWNCGEMQSNDIDDMYNNESPCRSGSQVVYAWARDAPALHLPEGVGFLIGKDSDIKYLVLQVHYMAKYPEGKTDNSGVTISYTKSPMPRQAGVILLGTGGMVPAHQVVHLESACTIQDDKVIHPFGFRTHTHRLGKVVSGYLVRKHPDGDEWQLIGKKDPMLPQMFYPVANTTPIHKGDILAARCTINNTRDHEVRIGPHNDDEMCNFYVMYWVENGGPLTQKYCFTNGYPYYSWANSPMNFNRIPDRDASTL